MNLLESNKIKKEIEMHKQDFLDDLKKIIRIKSVASSPQTDAPFGKGPREALDNIVSLAKLYGFRSEIVGNAMAYVHWGPENIDHVAVVGHLDVVAAGDGWFYPPFELTEDNGFLYGRGILDNKGPSMTCLYGMKLLKDMGVKPKRPIRLIFGSNEESGSQDNPIYLKHQSAPSFGFTPDCKFPVVYGERGIVSYEISTNFSENELKQIEKIEGNQASDHVPDELKVTTSDKVIDIQGKRSPINAPEFGQNAITYLAKKIKEQNLMQGKMSEYFSWLYDVFHEKHYGEGLEIEFSDEESGKLIQTPYMLQKRANQLVLSVAIRYPVTVTEQQITSRIKETLPFNSKLKIIRSFPSVLHNKEETNIQKLSNIYGSITGLDSNPVTTTGATYARVMPNIVAFGPSFPGQKGIAHRQNEWMKLTDLLKIMEIYMQSIYTLTVE